MAVGAQPSDTSMAALRQRYTARWLAVCIATKLMALLRPYGAGGQLEQATIRQPQRIIGMPARSAQPVSAAGRAAQRRKRWWRNACRETQGRLS